MNELITNHILMRNICRGKQTRSLGGRVRFSGIQPSGEERGEGSTKAEEA